MALDRRAGILLIAIEIIMIPLFGFQLYYGRDANPVVLKVKSAHPSYYPMFQDIHVMLLVGFGFLMTFLRRYGFSSVSFNFLLCAVMMQWGLLIQSLFKSRGITIISLIETDILVAAVLISFGCILGKTSPVQFVLMALLEVPFYLLNEHIGAKMSIWKKCIKRFSKKKLKQGDPCCSKSGHVQQCIPVTELGTPCTSGQKDSLEQLSLYSTDSLEEKSFFIRKYGSKNSYIQQIPKKSKSLESIITNSIISDISEDSLQIGSYGKENFWKPIKDFSNKVLLPKWQTRNRSQTVGQSYQLEKLFNRRGQKIFTDDQIFGKIPPAYDGQLLQFETVSIDSLENQLAARLNTLKKQFISEDSLNKEKKEYFDELDNGLKTKSISDGLLHESHYFQHLFHNSDFVVFQRILTNEMKKQNKTGKKLPKYDNDQRSLISLIKLQCTGKYESEYDNLSVDSLSIPKTEFVNNISCGVSELCLKIMKPASPKLTSCKQDITDNYESGDEKISVDSLSITQCELSYNHPEIKEEYLKQNELFSSSTFSYKDDKPNSKKLKINQHYQFIDRKCRLNGESFNNFSLTNNSIHSRNTGKEDSISIDSLCDSLN